MKILSKFFIVVCILNFFLSCSSDDDIKKTPILTEEQLHGAWRISYFWNQTDKTSEFEGYVISFSNLVNTTKSYNEEFLTTSGEYVLSNETINNKAYSILDLSFNSLDNETVFNANFTELTEQWIVKRINNDVTVIEFEERISDNPPEILHLTKIELTDDSN